jgi:hypothetical protein
MWNFLKSLYIWLECSSMLAIKPTEREAFGCKALGKANCEDDNAQHWQSGPATTFKLNINHLRLFTCGFLFCVRFLSFLTKIMNDHPKRSLFTISEHYSILLIPKFEHVTV